MSKRRSPEPAAIEPGAADAKRAKHTPGPSVDIHDLVAEKAEWHEGAEGISEHVLAKLQDIAEVPKYVGKWGAFDANDRTPPDVADYLHENLLCMARKTACLANGDDVDDADDVDLCCCGQLYRYNRKRDVVCIYCDRDTCCKACDEKSSAADGDDVKPDTPCARWVLCDKTFWDANERNYGSAALVLAEERRAWARAAVEVKAGDAE
jgi:hypothetical protein